MFVFLVPDLRVSLLTNTSTILSEKTISGRTSLGPTSLRDGRTHTSREAGQNVWHRLISWNVPPVLGSGGPRRVSTAVVFKGGITGVVIVCWTDSGSPRTVALEGEVVIVWVWGGAPQGEGSNGLSHLMRLTSFLLRPQRSPLLVRRLRPLTFRLLNYFLLSLGIQHRPGSLLLHHRCQRGLLFLD